MLPVPDPRKELIGTPQVRAIGGYNAYAQLLQATLKELVRQTVGLDGGSGRPAGPLKHGVANIPRPKAYEVEWFCIHVWWHQRELPAPMCLHIHRASSSHVTVCPGSEFREWQFFTLLPAVEYPIVKFPATALPGQRQQWVLQRFEEERGGHDAASEGNHSGMCAGPHFLRAQARATISWGDQSYMHPDWPTNFGKTTMPKIRKQESAFGPNATHIHVSGHGEYSHEFDFLTAVDPHRTLFQQQQTPAWNARCGRWAKLLTDCMVRIRPSRVNGVYKSSQRSPTHRLSKLYSTLACVGLRHRLRYCSLRRLRQSLHTFPALGPPRSGRSTSSILLLNHCLMIPV